jgi:hypothetical protein
LLEYNYIVGPPLNEFCECISSCEKVCGNSSQLATRPNATMEELIVFSNSSEKNDKKKIGEVQQLAIEALEA